MKLTQEQLGFFDTFGYLMIPQLFSQDETDKIIQVIRMVDSKSRPAARIMMARRALCFWDQSNAIPTCVVSLTIQQYLVSLEAFWVKTSTTAAVTEIIIAAIQAGTPMEAGVSYSLPKRRSISIHSLVTPALCGSYRVPIDPTILCARKKSM